MKNQKAKQDGRLVMTLVFRCLSSMKQGNPLVGNDGRVAEKQKMQSAKKYNCSLARIRTGDT